MVHSNKKIRMIRLMCWIRTFVNVQAWERDGMCGHDGRAVFYLYCQTESYAVAVSSKRFDSRGCRGLIWGSNWYQFNCFDKLAHEIQNSWTKWKNCHSAVGFALENSPCGDVVVEQTFGMIFLRATRPLIPQGYTYITNRSAWEAAGVPINDQMLGTERW